MRTTRSPVGLALTLVALGGIHSPATAQSTYSIRDANAFVAAKDWTGLARYSRSWTQAEPRNPMAWFYLGNTYGIGLHQLEPARDAFRHVVALKPDMPQAWNALGQVSAQLNLTAEAIDAFRHATTLVPTRPSYWNNLAAAYSYANQFARAETTLEQGQAASGAQATAADWYNFGNGFGKLLVSDKATYCYQQALRLDRQFANAWNNLGAEQQVLGNTAAALQDYREASRLGDPLGGENYSALQAAIAAAEQARTARAHGFVPGASSSSASSSAPSGGCGYSSYAACNAAKVGEYWAADRIENHSSTGSENDWYNH